MTIADLIKSVEGLTGPDASIDAAVTAALHGATVKPYPPTDDFGPRNKWQFWSRDGQHFLGSEHKFKVAPVTASIEAVIALIGETTDWRWVLHGGGDTLAHAVIEGGHGDIWIELAAVDAPTPALALLLAFLRAWEARNNG